MICFFSLFDLILHDCLLFCLDSRKKRKKEFIDHFFGRGWGPGMSLYHYLLITLCFGSLIVLFCFCFVCVCVFRVTS